MRDMPLLTVMPTFKETLGRLMHQDPIFPKGHQLIGYHYSGNNNKKKLFMLIASISCHVLSLCLSLQFMLLLAHLFLLHLFSPQALTAGQQRRSGFSIRGSLPTGRTSFWCRNWYAH